MVLKECVHSSSEYCCYCYVNDDGWTRCQDARVCGRRQAKSGVTALGVRGLVSPKAYKATTPHSTNNIYIPRVKSAFSQLLALS